MLAMYSIKKVVCGQLLYNNIAIKLKSTFDIFLFVIDMLEYLHVTKNTKEGKYYIILIFLFLLQRY